ncbi:hypothetical protein Cgig2_028638 [Carnegiea gigantea]|uniref:AMP-dependent synthetase/ligase domain-containing protein n=1 Tax=Carnegiea gigantea TaxID=171969 RepID=A0A9Q1JXM1_9CARY|nr:hypothetical protein Cgig2_028638 [Carnegiea gigantea]
MATSNISLASGVLFNCFDHPRHALHFLPSKPRWVLSNFAKISREPYGSYGRMPTVVCCQTTPKTEELKKRRCAPLLECEVLSSRIVWGPSNWKAVPDIWRTAAEKYADHTAVVDPYHDPPLRLTYKQLEQEILDFSEGLRVAGIVPDEKLALFADNSCRWLIADQDLERSLVPSP